MNPLSLKPQQSRIGIDARFFGSRDKGLGIYTENLIKELEEIDSQSQYFIFLGKERWKYYNPQSSNFRKVLFEDLNNYKLDLMHFTYFRDAVFYKRKFIVTIHDLITSHVSFSKKIAYRIILKLVLKKAEKIIAVSEFTKKDILKHYKIKPNKIEVIYEGVV